LGGVGRPERGERRKAKELAADAGIRREGHESGLII